MHGIRKVFKEWKWQLYDFCCNQNLQCCHFGVQRVFTCMEHSWIFNITLDALSWRHNSAASRLIHLITCLRLHNNLFSSERSYWFARRLNSIFAAIVGFYNDKHSQLQQSRHLQLNLHGFSDQLADQQHCFPQCHFHSHCLEKLHLLDFDCIYASSNVDDSSRRNFINADFNHY